LRSLAESGLEEAEWAQARFDQLNLIEGKRLAAIKVLYIGDLGHENSSEFSETNYFILSIPKLSYNSQKNSLAKILANSIRNRE